MARWMRFQWFQWQNELRPCDVRSNRGRFKGPPFLACTRRVRAEEPVLASPDDESCKSHLGHVITTVHIDDFEHFLHLLRPVAGHVESISIHQSYKA